MPHPLARTLVNTGRQEHAQARKGQISMAMNSTAHFDAQGIQVCSISEQEKTTADATNPDMSTMAMLLSLPWIMHGYGLYIWHGESSQLVTFERVGGEVAKATRGIDIKMALSLDLAVTVWQPSLALSAWRKAT